MFERLLDLLTHLKAGASAGVFVVGATGVLITGTVTNGDVRLTVQQPVPAAASPSPTPGGSPTVESALCVEALRARDEAARAIATDRERTLGDLRTLKEIAAGLARSANKDLPDATLEAARRELAAEIDRISVDATRAVRQAIDLAPCEDGDPTTGLIVDIADLRQRYRVIVEQTQQQLRGVLQRAAEVFERLVREARAKKQQASSASGASGASSGSSG